MHRAPIHRTTFQRYKGRTEKQQRPVAPLHFAATTMDHGTCRPSLGAIAGSDAARVALSIIMLLLRRDCGAASHPEEST